MQDQSPVCRICLKPKGNSSAGFITQFIDRCCCASLPAEQFEAVETCTSCGRRITAARSGSLTQWIFRAAVCECQRSKVAPHDSASSSTTDDNPTADLLDVDSTNFPVHRYRPLQVLGAGAAGKTYKCVDTLLKKTVCVKVLQKLTD
ncbi:MAG: hypothetical protein K2Z81_10150, partial [Cyanobacteria bacterium]|nr:hypothetical protein [Cyanobacteriota bacterium]